MNSYNIETTCHGRQTVQEYNHNYQFLSKGQTLHLGTATGLCRESRTKFPRDFTFTWCIAMHCFLFISELCPLSQRLGKVE